MIYSQHYTVRRLPNRIKEIRYANVDGHSTMDLGEDLYEITQTGLLYVGDATDNAIARVLFADRPGIPAGTDLVTVDTLGMGVFENCRLVDCEIERESVYMVRYKLIWRQTQTGARMAWPY